MMRIPSRRMPKFVPKPTHPAVWVMLAGVVGPLLYVMVQKPVYGAMGIVALIAIWAIAHDQHRREQITLRKFAAARPGQYICEFARDFDARAVDTLIIRAVYEQLQERLHEALPSFPIHADDNLTKDLLLDDEDLDMHLAPEIATRTGRSLDNIKANPYAGKVQTVRDLVLFFQAQPKRCA